MRRFALVFLLFLLPLAVVGDTMESTAVATGTSDVQVVSAPSTGQSGSLMFCGFAARETVGSAASTVVLHNGTSTSGAILFGFSLVASESRSEGPWEPSACILADGGIYMDRGGSGSTQITIYSRIQRPQ